MTRLPLILKLIAALAILIALAGTLGAVLSGRTASRQDDLTFGAFRAIQIKGENT